LGLACNKNDLYDKEAVSKEEGENLAKEIGAIFQETSAKASTGINDLFIKAGKKFIDPNCNVNEETNNKNEENEKKNTIQLDKKKTKKTKKGCC